MNIEEEIKLISRRTEETLAIVVDHFKDVDERIEEIEYKPGRIVLFDAGIPHRGLAPLNKYAYRYTTVYRVVMEDLDRFF